MSKIDPKNKRLTDEIVAKKVLKFRLGNMVVTAQNVVSWKDKLDALDRDLSDLENALLRFAIALKAVRGDKKLELKGLSISVYGVGSAFEGSLVSVGLDVTGKASGAITRAELKDEPFKKGGGKFPLTTANLLIRNFSDIESKLTP